MGARGRKSASESATPPPLQLVSPVPLELPDPPSHLSPQMQSWWRTVVEAYELDSHHLKLLEAAADAWDRMAQARATVLAEGITVQGVHGPKTNPACNVERDSRAAFARLIRELDLDEPVPSPGRYMPPPSLRSNRRR
jgi:P27 family predicted phage terminase small subunit